MSIYASANCGKHIAIESVCTKEAKRETVQDLKSEERGRVLTPQMKVGQCAKESLFNRSPLLEFQILEENEHIWGA